MRFSQRRMPFSKPSPSTTGIFLTLLFFMRLMACERLSSSRSVKGFFTHTSDAVSCRSSGIFFICAMTSLTVTAPMALPLCITASSRAPEEYMACTMSGKAVPLSRAGYLASTLLAFICRKSTFFRSISRLETMPTYRPPSVMTMLSCLNCRMRPMILVRGSSTSAVTNSLRINSLALLSRPGIFFPSNNQRQRVKKKMSPGPGAGKNSKTARLFNPFLLSPHMQLAFPPGLKPEPTGVPAGVSFLSNALHDTEFASFSLGCRFDSALSEAEQAALRKDVQAELVRGLEKALNKSFQPHGADVDCLLDFVCRRLELRLSPVYVCGRYNKFSRSLAQTTHYCFKCKGRGRGCAFCHGTGRLSEESVEELLAHVRPFVFELVEPRRRSANLEALATGINAGFPGKLRVSVLCFCGKESVSEYKNAEHEKRYAAVVTGSAPFDLSRLSPALGQRLSIEQRTPLRVSKRRPDKLRAKYTVLESVKPLDAASFELVLRASSGLYVKEFVSGDEGRSMPNLASLLGVPCTCTQLDVLEILDAPAPVI